MAPRIVWGANKEKSTMTMIANYPSKKALKAEIGNRLDYIETSFFGPQYKSNGMVLVANRPHITGQGREFFAEVTMRNDIIWSVK
jgi:hypothetical protein|tara:strand:+ start:5549 stop:5803 length:255 start_codon:yes stop_codon:yes gene_type:complete